VTTRYLRLGIPLVCLLGLALAGAGEIGAGSSTVAAQARPNIVVIMTDDQTIENLRVMRNVRRLIQRQGTTFSNFMVSFPLCCPSRATFLTGQYSHNTGVVGNNYANGYSRFDQTNTLPVWLHRAGYRTIMVGKYLNDYGKRASRHYVPPGWDRWNAALRVNYLYHTVLINRKITAFGGGRSDYSTDVYSRLALDAVRDYAPRPRPFFLWLSFFAPHDGGPSDADDPPGLATPSPAPRHADRFSRVNLPRWPSLNERDVTDKPADIRRRPLLDEAQLTAIREKYQQRLESLLAVDEAVGRLVAELRRLKELNRTVILFTSDNGFLEGQHRVLTGKELVYEPSVRVPLLMRGPRIPRGLKLSQSTANIDLAPTIVALAHARADLPPDGRSLLPLLRDPTLEWGRDILLERGPGNNEEGPRLYTAIRTPRLVYVEYARGDRELYDLTADPDEMQNLYGTPAAATLTQELARRLGRLRECVSSFCRVAPALTFTLAYQGGCAAQQLKARVAGADERNLQYVDFVVDGHRTRVTKAPFEQLLPPAAAPVGAKLRAQAVLNDGRRMTLDQPVRGC
jgi:N-acetylglucosamine-6-sulfatase